MAHQFTIYATIYGISIDQAKQLSSEIDLHEAVCKRIPGENIEILESVINGDIYTLRREYNLDVNIPDVAKKLLKNAFRLKRKDINNLQTMLSDIELGANLPLEAKGVRAVTGDNEKINIRLDWTVKVKVPLVGGMLEKHAEGEIRKFSQLEIEIVEDEMKKRI